MKDGSVDMVFPLARSQVGGVDERVHEKSSTKFLLRVFPFPVAAASFFSQTYRQQDWDAHVPCGAH